MISPSSNLVKAQKKMRRRHLPGCEQVRRSHTFKFSHYFRLKKLFQLKNVCKMKAQKIRNRTRMMSNTREVKSLTCFSSSSSPGGQQCIFSSIKQYAQQQNNYNKTTTTADVSRESEHQKITSASSSLCTICHVVLF